MPAHGSQDVHHLRLDERLLAQPGKHGFGTAIDEVPDAKRVSARKVRRVRGAKEIGEKRHDMPGTIPFEFGLITFFLGHSGLVGGEVRLVSG